VDGQLAKNWEVRERYRLKFSMDFFDLLNRANFNSSSMEGAGWAPANIQCGPSITVLGTTTTAPCSASNKVISSNSTPTGFGAVSALQSGKGFREVQYSLKFSF
jgi:hypothetical protein